LNNEVSVNLGVAYYKSLLRKPVQDRSIDITAIGMANLGNAYTDLSGGMLFRFGLMENFSNSVHFSSRVTADATHAPKHRNELYFFVQPMLTWQLYNATLQGGYFLNNKGPLTVETEPFYLTTQMGFKFAQDRWTFAAHYVNRTLQATKQIRNENFISFQVAYRMGDIIK
jgi:lipid A 3-O-deacylase